jgi:mannose-6-phosphate isomerase-like protein (cupin superfamily)
LGDIVRSSVGEMTMIEHLFRSPTRQSMPLFALAVVGLIVLAIACHAPASQANGAGQARNVSQAILGPPRPTVIALAEGERRFLRGGEAPLLIKIDPVNTGSQRMVLGSSDLPAGDAIGMHRHLKEDEILIVLRGNAHVDLAGRKYEAGPGGAIYIPQGTCVAVANAGRDTLTTFFVFSSPGFEQVLREVSSRAGEPPKRVSPLERIAAFHRGHAEASPVDC